MPFIVSRRYLADIQISHPLIGTPEGIRKFNKLGSHRSIGSHIMAAMVATEIQGLFWDPLGLCTPYMPLPVAMQLSDLYQNMMFYQV